MWNLSHFATETLHPEIHVKQKPFGIIAYELKKGSTFLQHYVFKNNSMLTIMTTSFYLFAVEMRLVYLEAGLELTF